MGEPLAYEVNGRVVEPAAFYAVACDPRRSVAVEACAGAGKTWMLVSRILRALLEGTAPHEILAITFTRKAAGEMRQRLQEWLTGFSQASDGELEQALRVRGVPAADVARLREPLRGLHAQVLAAGRGVQVRTFHGWFAALLRNAPLATLQQLGLPGRSTLLEDDSEAIDKVWRRFHITVAADPQRRADYEQAVAAHGRFQLLKALRGALDKRVEFALADAQGVVEASVSPFGHLHPTLASFDAPEDALATPAARARWMAWARDLGRHANKTPQKAAEAILQAFDTTDLADRFALLRKALFVAEEDRLNKNLAKIEAAQAAEPELHLLCVARAQHDAWLHHTRLTRLSRVLLAEYAALKREEGWIDMADVERAAHRLLSDEVLAGWIQERLDARVRHLLVDEFQDTNPLQWQALHAWLSSYAGAGKAPGVFIVGDPKQSIYRFRRAEPQVFAAAQAFVVEGLQGERLACDHTRRNAPEVLAAVNAVMSQAQAAGEYEGYRQHTTGAAHSGGVWQLPVIPRPTTVDGDDETSEGWRDSLLTPRELPEERLVTLECRQAAQWIAQRLGAGLQPSELLVLARRRDRLAAMEDELRALRIPAQQPEKSRLGEAPEVQDLLALLDVLVSPTHDLSLARALKSPLFGIDDAGLAHIALAARRRSAEGSPRPWLALLEDATLGWPEPLARATRSLQRWRGWVRDLPPHDALHAIYFDGQVPARFAQAAPPALRAAVLANVQALPAAALALDGGRFSTPYAFVRALRTGAAQGPGVDSRDAVRLLTVHGAKGLEAKVVLMLDTDPQGARAESMAVLVDWPGEDAFPRRFSFIASETRPPACNAQPLDIELAARRREELNALYVAMTRAQEVLVISAVAPKTPAAGSWFQRLAPLAQPLEAPAEGRAALEAGATFELPDLPAAAAAPQPVARDVGTVASRTGELLHRLLELHGGGVALPAGAALARVGRAFALDATQAQQARGMAQRVLAGEGAWCWDPAQVAWAGDEVELVHEGEVLRLDRLVRRRDGAWWVLDHKSAAHPERDATLQDQLRRYVRAVQDLHPAAAVHGAFLTGDGRLVAIA